MDVEVVKCECCGLKEECTLNYINGVKAKFNGKWLCGLCSEAVRDEVSRAIRFGKKQSNTSSNTNSVEDAVKAHMSFCGKYKSNPAFRVADGMRQMLRRRSVSDKSLLSGADPSPGVAPKKYYSRSASASQVGDESVFSSTTGLY